MNSGPGKGQQIHRSGSFIIYDKETITETKFKDSGVFYFKKEDR